MSTFITILIIAGLWFVIVKNVIAIVKKIKANKELKKKKEVQAIEVQKNDLNLEDK